MKAYIKISKNKNTIDFGEQYAIIVEDGDTTAILYYFSSYQAARIFLKRSSFWRWAHDDIGLYGPNHSYSKGGAEWNKFFSES
jgi:hypothetical protein